MADNSKRPSPTGWQNPATGTGTRAETSGSTGSGSITQAVKEKTKDVASGAGELVSGAKEKVHEWASAAADVAGQAKDKAQELATTAVHRVKDLGQGLTDLIRRYPLPALLVGFGIGFLASRVIRRS